MILYNVTVNVDDSIHKEWLEWMKKEHIPNVMATGLFTGNKVYKIKSTQPGEGDTYSIQYFCAGMEDYEKYQKEHAPALQQEHTEKYKDKFSAFRTILELVE